MSEKPKNARLTGKLRKRRTRLHGRALVTAKVIAAGQLVSRRTKSRAVHTTRPSSASEIIRSLGIGVKDLMVASKATGISLEKD
jgi:hypothetical protein